MDLTVTMTARIDHFSLTRFGQQESRAVLEDVRKRIAAQMVDVGRLVVFNAAPLVELESYEVTLQQSPVCSAACLPWNWSDEFIVGYGRLNYLRLRR